MSSSIGKEESKYILSDVQRLTSSTINDLEIEELLDKSGVYISSYDDEKDEDKDLSEMDAIIADVVDAKTKEIVATFIHAFPGDNPCGIFITTTTPYEVVESIEDGIDTYGTDFGKFYSKLTCNDLCV